jgi:YesN/AraC family two-component response regulator
MVKNPAAQILIVDDDPGTTEGFRCILSLEGFDVRTALTARDGIDQAGRLRPDLLLLDLRLPDMTGLDVLRSLRNARIDVPCVMMSAWASVAETADAFKLGVRDFVEKPLDEKELVRIVRGSTNRLSVVVDWRVVETVRIIEQRYGEPGMSLRVVARELDVSVEHLCRLLKRQTGTGFGRRLHETRVHEARRLLRETNMSVKEVAYRTGYSDTARLSHYFKRFCRVLPTAFRQAERASPSTPTGRNQ